MEKINRDEFYNTIHPYGQEIGEGMVSAEIQEFSPQKAIETLANKIDEIIEQLNNK